MNAVMAFCIVNRNYSIQLCRQIVCLVKTHSSASNTKEVELSRGVYDLTPLLSALPIFSHKLEYQSFYVWL